MPVEEVDFKIPYIGGIKWKPDREEAEVLQAAVQEYLHALEVMAGIQPGANFPLD